MKSPSLNQNRQGARLWWGSASVAGETRNVGVRSAIIWHGLGFALYIRRFLVCSTVLVLPCLFYRVLTTCRSCVFSADTTVSLDNPWREFAGTATRCPFSRKTQKLKPVCLFYRVLTTCRSGVFSADTIVRQPLKRIFRDGHVACVHKLQPNKTRFAFLGSHFEACQDDRLLNGHMSVCARKKSFSDATSGWTELNWTELSTRRRGFAQNFGNFPEFRECSLQTTP